MEPVSLPLSKMSVADVKPSAPKVSAEGGTAIRFTLGDYMFGPGFDPSSVTVPSACYFGSMRVDGEFDAMKSQWLMPRAVFETNYKDVIECKRGTSNFLGWANLLG